MGAGFRCVFLGVLLSTVRPSPPLFPAFPCFHASFLRSLASRRPDGRPPCCLALQILFPPSLTVPPHAFPSFRERTLAPPAPPLPHAISFCLGFASIRALAGPFARPGGSREGSHRTSPVVLAFLSLPASARTRLLPLPSRSACGLSSMLQLRQAAAGVEAKRERQSGGLREGWESEHEGRESDATVVRPTRFMPCLSSVPAVH